MGLYIRPNNVSGRLIFSYRCHCATTYRSRTNRPTGCRPMVGWLVGWIEYKIYRANIARAPKLDSLTGYSRSRPMVVGRIYRRRFSRDWFPQSHWTPAESSRPSHEAPPQRGCHWLPRSDGHGTSRWSPSHRTLGMRKRASDPGDANASIGSWEYECVQIIMFIMLVLVV